MVKIVSEDIGEQIGFEKCTVLKMTRGKQIRCDGADSGDD